MPSLSAHHSVNLVKGLIIGDSMAGKTGALISLVEAGYKLRILDLDNKLDILRQLVLRQCPQFIDNIDYRTIRDKRRNGALGPVIDGKPRAYSDTIKMIDEWKYTDEVSGVSTDLGRPDSWGPDSILVLDSLSRFCDSAYDHYELLVPKGKGTGEIDARAVYGNAQDGVEAMLAHLTAETYRTNVLVIAHVQYVELPDKTTKGFPQGVGQKLSPKVPQYFPTSILVTKRGEKRSIRTASTPLIDLANPKPFDISADLDHSTGLATIFKELLSAPNAPKATPAPAPKPPLAQIKRPVAAATLRR